MSRVKQTKNSRPEAITQGVDHLKYPVFSFSKIKRGEYHINECEQEFQVGFIQKLVELSSLSWQQLHDAHKRGVGFEQIAHKAIKDKSVNNLPEDITLIVFRFHEKGRIVGYRYDRNVFYIVWVDSKLTLYDHS
ncbi:MAG: hypothetical protein LBC09_04125 [Helicobacteraceae bacterium]|nr:hypothetical protein [Helicobacteraceae bacterium]